MIGVGWDFNNEKESVTTKPASRGDQESTVYDEYIQYLLGSEANTPKRNELISQIDSLKAGKAALENYINNLSTGSNFQLKVDELVQYDGMTPEQATAQVLQTMGLANIGSQLTNFNAQIKDLETQLSDIPEGGGEKTPSYLDQLTEYAAPYIDDLGKIKAEYQALQQEAAAGNREALTKLKALEGQYGGLLGTQDAMMSTIFNKDYKPLNLGSFQGQALGQMYPHYKKAQEIQANKQGILGDMGNLQNDIMAGINANATGQSSILKDIEAMSAAEVNAKATPLNNYLQKLEDLHTLNEQMRYKVGTQRGSATSIGFGLGLNLGGMGGGSTAAK